LFAKRQWKGSIFVPLSLGAMRRRRSNFRKTRVFVMAITARAQRPA
jgi:hypothetical protein